MAVWSENLITTWETCLRFFQPIGDGLQNIRVFRVGVVEAGCIDENDIATVVHRMRNAEGLNFVSA